MAQQLHLFSEAPTSVDRGSESLLEQTRQLFQHSGSNAELMTQIINAIRVLNDICEQPKQ